MRVKLAVRPGSESIGRLVQRRRGSCERRARVPALAGRGCAGDVALDGDRRRQRAVPTAGGCGTPIASGRIHARPSATRRSKFGYRSTRCQSVGWCERRRCGPRDGERRDEFRLRSTLGYSNSAVLVMNPTVHPCPSSTAEVVSDSAYIDVQVLHTRHGCSLRSIHRVVIAREH